MGIQLNKVEKEIIELSTEGDYSDEAKVNGVPDIPIELV
jgi:hypothetical protein